MGFCLMVSIHQHSYVRIQYYLLPTLDPMAAIFLSILVEQDKEIILLREKLSF
jgi:hypothetical protein